jgi:hypothetical protein
MKDGRNAVRDIALAEKPVLGSLDKKDGRRFYLSGIFCLIKRFHFFQQNCLTNPTQPFDRYDQRVYKYIEGNPNVVVVGT